MNKVCASILIFVALFALVGAEDFKRIPLSQGVLRMRNLATATATTPKYTFANHSNNTAAAVNLGSYYLNNMGLDSATPTDMLLFLYTNVTGFCYDCNDFVRIGCTTPSPSYSNNCSADTTQKQTMLSPYYQVTTGYPFNFSNLTIGNDSSAWKLTTTALLSDSSSIYTIYWPGYYSYSYIRNSSTYYGYIGLGVGGNASKNFQTTTPIFSIQVNNSGVGSLIFGKDTTLYDSKRTAMTLTTDTNWTMISRNISWGTVNNTNMISNVIFDLQHPGIGLPETYYGAIVSLFQTKYNFTITNSSYGNVDYPNLYNGSLSNLPELVIGLTNDKNLTLPPSAYTRKVADNLYALLVHYAPSAKNLTSNAYVNYTVLGWPVLSQFYTVFELPATGVPTITLYPTFNATANGVSDTSSGSSFSLKTLAIVAAVVLVVLVALSAVCKKKQDFTKSDLGVELRAARV